MIQTIPGVRAFLSVSHSAVSRHNEGAGGGQQTTETRLSDVTEEGPPAQRPATTSHVGGVGGGISASSPLLVPASIIRSFTL